MFVRVWRVVPEYRFDEVEVEAAVGAGLLLLFHDGVGRVE
jgi:hypothetical protein